jgi:hypothetical protein
MKNALLQHSALQDCNSEESRLTKQSASMQLRVLKDSQELCDARHGLE